MNDLIPEANMAKVQSKDGDERSGGGGRSGGGDGGDGGSDDRGSIDDFPSYLSGASTLPPTTSGSSSAPPVFLAANFARVGNDDAAPPSDVEPIEPSAPPLSEMDAEESTKTYSMPSVVFATPIPPPFAPRNYAMAWTTAAVDDCVIATPVASSATTMAAFPDSPSDPPEMAAFRDRHQPTSTGNEAWDATTTLSAPANQGGYEQRIREYKLGLVSLGLLAAVAIIAAVVVVGVYRPDPPSVAPTSALISSGTNASSSASPTAIPTSTPTASPTSTPTAIPTSTPTASPSEYQTTASPSEVPTTASPTIAPTTSPITTSPSESPTTASPLMILTSAPVAYPPAPWIWEQQGKSIVGDAEDDQFGWSVAMSADAKTLAVGARGSNNWRGYVKVYHTNDDGWNSTQLIGQSILGDAVGDSFGQSVDMSPDGKTVAIGAPASWEMTDRPGYVRVYHLESNGLTSSWKQLGQDIIGEADGDEFGFSVSLSDDGKTLAIGARYNDGNGDSSGCVRIYHYEGSGKNWEQIGQDIYGEAAGDILGFSLSLSADGTTVVTGAPWSMLTNSEYSGQVRVYQIDSAGSTWEQLGQNIIGEAVDDFFGWSVDMSPDGNTLVIGALVNRNDRPGYVRVYYLESNEITSSWTQLGQDIIGEAAYDDFGSSVSLSDDGKTLAIGARQNDGNGVYSGHVGVYRMDDSSTSWTQLGEKINGKAAFDGSGQSVSLSEDGTTVAIGAYLNDDNGFDSGHVRIFSIK
jgi:hypothetical protein